MNVMSHVYAYGQQCPKAKGIIHLGGDFLFNVGDNTDLIIMTEGMQLLRKKLLKVIARLSDFAQKEKAQPTLGFTHFQPGSAYYSGKTRYLMDSGFADGLRGIGFSSVQNEAAGLQRNHRDPGQFFWNCLTATMKR